MCRWIAYQGEPIFLDELIATPCRSLIVQSRTARHCEGATNGDGFGIGWYGERETPGVYRDLRPAWSDENLKTLCEQIRSRLFVAHVRASTGTSVERANCHPFAHGRFLFVHNGQIGGYPALRRRVEALIPDALYGSRGGATDSEAIFLAALARAECRDPVTAVAETLGAIRAIMAGAGIQEPLRFTAALTDGRDLYAFRWASDGRAPTLYFRDTPRGLVVVSEPLDDAGDCWREVPQGCALVARAGRPTLVRGMAEEMRAAA